MQRIFLRYLFLFSIAIVLAGCSKVPDQLKLIKAEQLMESSPDSSLVILRKLDQQKLFGAHNKALYALLMSQALDKNDIKSESDTLITVATDYFSDSDPLHAAYAWFYRARVENNRDSLAKQAQYLLKAQQFAETAGNDKLSGLIFSDKASVFKNQLQYDSCIQYYKRGYKVLTKINDTQNRILCLINIGYSYLFISQLDSAEYYYLESKKVAINSKDTQLLSHAYKHLGALFFQKGNYKSALSYYQLVPSSNIAIYDYNNYSLIANTYEKLNQLDSAIVYLNKIHELGEIAPDYYRIWQNIYEKKGMASKAIYFANKGSNATDSIYKRKLETSFAGLDKKYRFQTLQLQNQQLIIKNKHNEFLLLVSILLLVVIIAAIFIVLFLSKRKEANYQKELALRNQELLVKEHEQVLNERHTNFLLERQLKLHGILLSNIDLHKNNSVKRPHIWNEGSKEMINQQQNTFYNELLTFVDLEFNNFTHRLKEKHPTLSDRDIFFSCLILSGFETGMIATIMSVQAESINKQRYRLRTKLKLLNSDNLYDYLLHF